MHHGLELRARPKDRPARHVAGQIEGTTIEIVERARTWGIPITAVGVILAIEGRDEEALRLLVAVGAHGRMWHARQEMVFVIHREYSRMIAQRLGDEATAAAWREGEAMTVEQLQEAVAALVAGAEQFDRRLRLLRVGRSSPSSGGSR